MAMKATPRQQLLLLDLQQLDHTIARLRRRSEQLPERAELAALDVEREAAKATYMDAQRELDAKRLELERIGSDVALIVQREHRDRELLAASTSPKEAVAIQSELDTLARRQSELEERQFEAMEIADAAETVFAEAERVLGGIDERRSAINARIAEAEQQIAAEHAQAVEDRAGLAAEVQGDLLALYERLRAQVGIGAARLRGGVSEASGMSLTPAELAGLKAAAPDEVIFCPGTGAILVRVDEEAVPAE